MKVVALLVLLWALAFTAATRCVAQSAEAPEASAEAPVQPLPFSHKKHAGDLQLPCQYCHVKPDPGVQMTYPSTDKCMACHAATAVDKPSIQKLTEFSKSGTPIPWVQIYSVPGFVFWSHDLHLTAKVECSACHGDVTKMDTMAKVTNVTQMVGCVTCHKQRSAPTGCMVCHETQTSHLLTDPLPAILRRIIRHADGM